MPPPFRHAAVQRILGTLGMALLRDTEGRSTPAKVYPVDNDSDTWIVEPPINQSDAATGIKTFTGHSALLKALEYAHCNYGSALYLSR